MIYIHPKRYKGTKTYTEHGENIIRNRVEEYCLKCDKFMGKDHDFSECETIDRWENGKFVKKKTCPFPNVGVSLLEPQFKCEIEDETPEEQRKQILDNFIDEISGIK